ncbi:MAG: zinc-binding alcohol dehydrogenase [Methylococcales bacterium]
MSVRELWFTQPYHVEVRERSLPPLASGHIRVKNECSAISAGTEMLVYRGQLPSDISLDATLESLQHNQTYPLQYGYACVGRVEQIGAEVDSSWLGKRVFSFQPHASHFAATPEQVILLPDDIEPEAAVFLANMETAVNLVLDGSPALGERVLILGQGVVGLLVSSLLAQFPLTQLVALESLSLRKAQSLKFGVQQVFDPHLAADLASLEQLLHLPVQLSDTAKSGADLIYEVSGVASALNLAINLSSYAGRIVIGSWYGNKADNLNLGGVAHRNRLKFISSQVSTIAPEWSGRWDKPRRFDVAWDMIRRVQPQQMISHRVPLEQAPFLYSLLDQAPEEILQAVLTY